MKNENYRICMQCKYIEPECECEEFKARFDLLTQNSDKTSEVGK